MFLLRRAAVRAITAQPSRQLFSLRPITSRVTLLDSAKPSLYRSFHQTRIWRAEEEQKKAEELKDEAAAAATAAEEAAEAAQEAAGEAIVEAAAEPVAEQPAQDAADVSSSATDAAQTAAAAASTAQSAAAAAAHSPFQPPPRSADFPPRETSPQAASHKTPTPIVYVGNLFFEVTVEQLEQEFARYGRVINSRIVSDARGLSKGFGYIEFESQEAADRAVRELDQKVFQGRRMAVQFHVRRQPRATMGGAGREGNQNQPSKTLFIGNMSYQMSDRDLNDLFREIRDVLDVRVAIDRRTGQPRGFAHADFIDVQSAQRAKEHLEKKVVYGRQLRIDFSESSSGRVQASGGA